MDCLEGGKFNNQEFAALLSELVSSDLRRLELTLKGNHIGSDGASWIGNRLGNLTALTSLTLSLNKNQIGDDGAGRIGDGIGRLTSLTSLSLSLNKNQIGDDGAGRIGDGIGRLTSLQSLTLGLCNNNVGPDGARRISIGLKPLATMASLILNLESNHIGDTGAEWIADGLERLSSLNHLALNFYNNDIGEEGAGRVVNKLEQLPPLDSFTFNLESDVSKMLATSDSEATTSTRRWSDMTLWSRSGQKLPQGMTVHHRTGPFGRSKQSMGKKELVSITFPGGAWSLSASRAVDSASATLVSAAGAAHVNLLKHDFKPQQIPTDSGTTLACITNHELAAHCRIVSTNEAGKLVVFTKPHADVGSVEVGQLRLPAPAKALAASPNAPYNCVLVATAEKLLLVDLISMAFVDIGEASCEDWLRGSTKLVLVSWSGEYVAVGAGDKLRVWCVDIQHTETGSVLSASFILKCDVYTLKRRLLIDMDVNSAGFVVAATGPMEFSSSGLGRVVASEDSSYNISVLRCHAGNPTLVGHTRHNKVSAVCWHASRLCFYSGAKCHNVLLFPIDAKATGGYGIGRPNVLHTFNSAVTGLAASARHLIIVTDSIKLRVFCNPPSTQDMLRTADCVVQEVVERNHVSSGTVISAAQSTFEASDSGAHDVHDAGVKAYSSDV